MGMLINPFVFGAAPTITSMVIQASAESTTANVTCPTTQAGDLLVFTDRTLGGSAPPNANPSGFTQIASLTNATRRHNASYKIALGTEGGTTLTGINSGVGTHVKMVVVYRPNIPIVSLTLAGVVSTLDDANPAAQTILSAAGAAPLIVIGHYMSNNDVDPRTFTVGGVGAKDGEQGHSGLSVYQAYKFYASSPADVVIDMDDEGSGNTLIGSYFALTS